VVQQSRREIRSFQISTFRSVLLHRGIQDGAGGDGDALMGLGDDCVQGMEKLVSSPSIRRNLVKVHCMLLLLRPCNYQAI